MLEQPPDEPDDAVADGTPGRSVVPAPTTGESDDADLAESLADLSTLSTGRLGLEDLLTRVATSAAHAIPGADGAGLTLIEEGRSDTIVKSAAFVKQVDDIQYSLNEGPCVRCWLSGQLQQATDPRAERWWRLVAIIQPPPDADPDGQALAAAHHRRAHTMRWLNAALQANTRLASTPLPSAEPVSV